jgi:site-specific DNA-methyltransferase (adenine-specific)
MGARPNLVYEYKGFTPGSAGWRVQRDVLEEIDRAGNLNWTGTGVRRKLRPDDIEKGQPIGSFWGDIPPINSQAQERLGYPTQKPEALLQRIIEASTNPGDVVLDPFCGCGTSIAVAQRTDRNWIGIDVTARAIEIVEKRLEMLDPEATRSYSLHGKPLTLEDAKRLANDNGYQFQRWILEMMDVLPRDIKPGADGGVDGRLYFIDAPSEGRTSEIIFSVKGGKNVGPDPVRALAGVVNGRAKIGVFVCFKTTDAMVREVANAEPFRSIHGEFPALQILKVDEILTGKRPLYPGSPQQAPQRARVASQLDLKEREQPSLYDVVPQIDFKRWKAAL